MEDEWPIVILHHFWKEYKLQEKKKKKKILPGNNPLIAYVPYVRMAQGEKTNCEWSFMKLKLDIHSQSKGE